MNDIDRLREIEHLLRPGFCEDSMLDSLALWGHDSPVELCCAAVDAYAFTWALGEHCGLRRGFLTATVLHDFFDACERGRESFLAAFPQGLETDGWTPAQQAGMLLHDELRGHLGWAWYTGVLPKHSMAGWDLRGADLRYADLTEADLRGADLRGADLFGALLDEADLRGGQLPDMQQDASITGARVTPCQLGCFPEYLWQYMEIDRED